MQVTVLWYSVAEFPLVPTNYRAYGRWEEVNDPSSEVRCGIDAKMVQMISGLGMETGCVDTISDSAFCVLEYCMNGLRENSVMSLLAETVSFDIN